MTVRTIPNGENRVLLAASSDIAEGDRLVVSVGQREVGIFRVQGQLYAYENICPHAGGPVCQGKILPTVVEVLDDQRKSRGFAFAHDRTLITCPWHGFEFEIETGEHPGKRDIRLRRVEVLEDSGQVFLHG